MLVVIKVKGLMDMRLIHSWYNMQNNSVEINANAVYILRIDYNKVEQGIAITHWDSIA